MRLPIKDLRELAKKRQFSHVVIFAYDGESQHVATYGTTTVAAGQAADFGNSMKTALGWPEKLHAQPSRVRRLQAENKQLRALAAKHRI